MFSLHINRIADLCGTCPGSLSEPDTVKPIFPNNTPHSTAARIKSLKMLLRSSAVRGTHSHSLSFRTGFSTLIGHWESQSDWELGNAYNDMTSTVSAYSKCCAMYPATCVAKGKKEIDNQP